jgi:hypothetical protein
LDTEVGGSKPFSRAAAEDVSQPERIVIPSAARDLLLGHGSKDETGIAGYGSPQLVTGRAVVPIFFGFYCEL